jgi:hypothetical protein
MNTFLARQFSGPVIQAVADGLQASFDATASLIAYWNALDLSSATGPELDFMGQIAGYHRPLVPIQFLSPNVFTLGNSALWEQVNVLTGLGDTTNPTIGGQLASVFGSVNSLMPDSWYRQIIPLVAQVKYYGLTLYTIDLVVGNIAALAGVTYLLSYKTNGDVVVTFSATITYMLLWVLQAVFSEYETSCVVTIVNP